MCGCVLCMTLYTRVKDVYTATTHRPLTFPNSQGKSWSDKRLQRPGQKETERQSLFLLSCTGHLVNMQQAKSVDPTKMGVGRAIAVLTSGGDAQGEEVCIYFYVITVLYSTHCTVC